MVASARSPEDIVNSSLVRIGYKDMIGTIYEGSTASKLALEIYADTRDEMLRQFEWGFAERDTALVLQKTAPVGGYTPPNVWSPTYPILPWIFQFAYPDDCIKVRALRVTPIIIPVYDPSPVEFRIANDNSFTPSQRVILCNLPAPVCVYTARVTDPTVWEPLFVEGLTAALARRLAPALANLDTQKFEAQDEALTTQQAEMRIG